MLTTEYMCIIMITLLKVVTTSRCHMSSENVSPVGSRFLILQ